MMLSDWHTEMLGLVVDTGVVADAAPEVVALDREGLEVARGGVTGMAGVVTGMAVVVDVMIGTVVEVGTEAGKVVGSGVVV
jgi:hypothetical protein